MMDHQILISYQRIFIHIQKFQKYLEIEEALEGYDFIISDFVYEAFALAHFAKKPSFGIAHFTWGWFFSKLVNKNLHKKTFKLFEDSIQIKKIFPTIYT